MVKNLLSIVVEPLRDPGRKIAELNSLVAASDSWLHRGKAPGETAADLVEFFSTLQGGQLISRPAQSEVSQSAVLDPPGTVAPITIITGSGRCGTSFTAQAFFAAGVDPGGAFGEDVRAGWEYAPVVAVNQELQQQALFPDEVRARRLAADYGERLRAAIAGKRIVKDPRFTYLLGIWAEAGLVGRVIHLVRTPTEVVNSARAAFPGDHPQRTLENIDRRTRYLAAVCVRYTIPRVVLRFPEVALEEGPDFQRLAAEIERLGVSRDRAVGAIRRTRNPDLVRHSPPGPATPAPSRAAGSLTSPSAQSVSVSIIIPVFNGLRYTRECLEALREHTVGDHEVIVVDNGSRDGTSEFLRTIAGLSILRNEENLGFARACNAGARRARGKYLLFLNNDAMPLPGWLPPLLAAAECREQAGVVGSLLLYPGERTVQHAGVCMNESGLPYHIFRHHPGDAAEVVCDREMPAVTGACLLTPRSLFLESGGFDEGYVNGLEDIDYCLRVREQGKRVYYTGTSILLHHESVSEGRLDDKTQQANVRRFRAVWGGKIRPDDPADYIPEGAVNTPFHRYDAGSTRLRHGTGVVEDSRLVCRLGEHAEGHCVHGPGLFVMGSQNLRAAFHLQSDDDSPPDQRIASLDIYDRRGENILCHRAVTSSQIRESTEGVVLTTPVALGQELEFRVYWHGGAELQFSHLQALFTGPTNRETEKLDVVVNVYGKPWQTLCMLKSLMLHSGKHIDKIFFIEEADHPFHDAVSQVAASFDNIVHFKPKHYIYRNNGTNLDDDAYRHAVRYQYGIEKSSKRRVFITHNDVLYTADIVGRMLAEIGVHAGIGLIGQCWNCPAFKAGLCDSTRFGSYRPTYAEIMGVSRTHRPARATVHDSLVDPARPMPLPECRLNEFACIIDREVSVLECYPNGTSPLFGVSAGIDTACGYFRSLILKGYTFKNYPIYADCVHGYFAKTCGTSASLDRELYSSSEDLARQYALEHFP